MAAAAVSRDDSNRASSSKAVPPDSSADPIEAAAEQWYQPGPSVLDQLTPVAAADEPHDSKWTIHPTGQWIMGNHPLATPEEMQQAEQLLLKYKGAFAYSMKEVVAYHGPLGAAEFQLKHNNPIRAGPRRFSPDEKALGQAKVDEMLDAGIVREVDSKVQYSSATMPMKRAPDGSWTDKRFCVDLRAINAATVPDNYGMPMPEELFHRVGSAKFLTKLDMRSGFFAIALEPASQLHTTFMWEGRHYAFNRLPFGHVNATAIFQKRMDLELQRAGLSHCTGVFVDDVLLFSDTMQEHLQQLEQLLQHFLKNNLRAHPAKTIVAADCLPYLGHLLSALEGKIKPDPAKVSAMVALQPPTSVRHLLAHLGLFNYYRCYIPEFSRYAQPLYQLTRKDVKFEWQQQHQQAYDQLKSALTVPGRALKQPDYNRPFRLYTDWSTHGISAVLNQADDEGHEYLVACVSRSLNQAEQHYAAWKGELLAVIFGLKAFRCYLLTREFTLFTDHRALLWLLTHKQPVGQQARWLLTISEFRFNLQHRAGKDNPADVPSREPVACAADWTGSRLDTMDDVQFLPKVYLADGELDSTVYTHDQLAADLCLTPKDLKKSGTQLVAAAAQRLRSIAYHSLVDQPAVLADMTAAPVAASAISSKGGSPFHYLACVAGSNTTAMQWQSASSLCALAATAADASAFSSYESTSALLLGGGRSSLSSSRAPLAARQIPSHGLGAATAQTPSYWMGASSL